MLRLRAEGKLQRATPEVRNSTRIYQSWSRLSPPTKNNDRYARNDEEHKQVASSIQDPATTRLKPHPVAKRTTREKGSLKSLEIHAEPPKVTSPNYNDLKVRRMIREQHRQQQLQSKSRSVLPMEHCQSGKIQQVGSQSKDRHTVSVERMDNSSIGQLVEKGAINEVAIKQYITQLQQVLVAIKQKQHSERSRATLKVNSTVKKNVTTERKTTVNSTNENNDSMMGGSVRRILFRPTNQRTIESEATDNTTLSRPKEDRGTSETSLRNTQHLANQLSRQHQPTNLLSHVISRSKQQRKLLNLIEVRERYKQEKEQNSANKASISEEGTKRQQPSQSEIAVSRRTQIMNQLAHSRQAVAGGDTVASMRQVSKTIEVPTSNNLHNKYRPIIHPVANLIEIPIEQEDSKVQVSNFSSPLQLPKRSTKADLLKLNLDISEINNRNPQAESMDSSDNILSGVLEQAPRSKLQRVRLKVDADQSAFRRAPENGRPKKKLIDVDRWKKNFPIGFFDLEA